MAETEAANEPRIHHVRYEDFFSLVSDGVGDLDKIRAAVDALVSQMGDPRHNHVLIDLRAATGRPIPGLLLVEAMSYLRAKMLGRANRVAFVIDRDDRRRLDLAGDVDRIATAMAMQTRSFVDYAAALEWLSEPRVSP